MLNDLEGETNPMAGADEVDRYGVWMATVAVGEAMIGDVVVDSKKSRKMRRVVRLEAENGKKVSHGELEVRKELSDGELEVRKVMSVGELEVRTVLSDTQLPI